MNNRSWVKMWCGDCINGSIRYQLNPAERGVWYDLVLFAGVCSENGYIGDKNKRPYPHKYIANRLNVGLKLLETTLNIPCSVGLRDEEIKRIINKLSGAKDVL